MCLLKHFKIICLCFLLLAAKKLKASIIKQDKEETESIYVYNEKGQKLILLGSNKKYVYVTIGGASSKQDQSLASILRLNMRNKLSYYDLQVTTRLETIDQKKLFDLMN